MARIISPILHILTTQKVRPAKQWFMGDAQEHPTITYPADFRECSFWVINMFEHLKANNQIKFMILKWQCQQIANTEGITGANMLCDLQRINLLIHADCVWVISQNMAHTKALTATSIQYALHY
jgi:hypothetical protein